LHQSWGPLEPFDDSVPEILKQGGVYTHLVSDHIHYWEDGGATYHTRYNSWEIIRGQEGDAWKVLPCMFHPSESMLQNNDAKYFSTTRNLHIHDTVNRKFLDSEDKMPMAITFQNGLDFIDHNAQESNWFLQIECFDPHEPFYSQQAYKDLYPDHWEGSVFDWPPYHIVTEDEETQRHLKYEYAALLSMCDHYLGKLLDKMDELDLWKDTMLIVGTDHGYLLGEHDWWSKTVMPPYDEIAHIPLFVYDPRLACQGQQNNKIVQTIDIPATLLEYFGFSLSESMQGKPLVDVMRDQKTIHEYALFGFFGAHINVFDGRYVYMRAPVSTDNQPLNEYTLMPMHMRSLFRPEDLSKAGMNPPFSFTKRCPVLKVPNGKNSSQTDFSIFLSDEPAAKNQPIDNNDLIYAANFGTKLFDLENDPKQRNELNDCEVEARMANLLIRAMNECDSPNEQFERVGLSDKAAVQESDVQNWYEASERIIPPVALTDREWHKAAVNTYQGLMRFIPATQRTKAESIIEQKLKQNEGKIVETEDIFSLIPTVIPKEYCKMVTYFLELNSRPS